MEWFHRKCQRIPDQVFQKNRMGLHFLSTITLKIISFFNLKRYQLFKNVFLDSLVYGCRIVYDTKSLKSEFYFLL